MFLVVLKWFLVYWLICTAFIIFRFKVSNWNKIEEYMMKKDARVNAIGGLNSNLKFLCTVFVCLISFIAAPHILFVDIVNLLVYLFGIKNDSQNKNSN